MQQQYHTTGVTAQKCTVKLELQRKGGGRVRRRKRQSVAKATDDEGF